MEIKIRVTPERMQELVTVDEYIALEEGKVRGVKDVVSNFLVDENGNYVPKSKAEKIIGSLKLGEITNISNQFIEAAKEAAGTSPKLPETSIKPTSESLKQHPTG